MADQHSILRSWAIKDFAPQTPQFVQLFRPENTINVKFAGKYSNMIVYI
jgi:potassium channel subfamily T member 1